MLRVRFAPSPTGFLHIGSARTFIFNWLYARHNGGTMILRIDDTDVGRNTDASSRFHFRRACAGSTSAGTRSTSSPSAWRCTARWPRPFFKRAWRIAIYAPPQAAEGEKSGAHGTWLFQRRTCARLPREESDRRAAAGEPFALRFRVPREIERQIRFTDAVYGEQSKATADIEDFALLRSDGMPTYHLASCADDADLRISHIIRGQDHLTNTFKHVLIFEAAGVDAAAVRASAAAGGARWRQALQAARTGRWSASPPTATPVFCRTLSSTSSACWAGRPRTTASR